MKSTDPLNKKPKVVVTPFAVICDVWFARLIWIWGGGGGGRGGEVLKKTKR